MGRTDAEAEAPILWPPDAKSWLIRKDTETGKDWRQEEKGTTEDEMIGWHHWLNDMSLSKLWEQTLGDCEVQGSLEVQGSPWGHKKSDSTEGLTQQLAFISDNIHLPWHKIHIKYMNLFIHLFIFFYLKFYGFILDTCANVYYSFFRNKFVVLNMHQSS